MSDIRPVDKKTELRYRIFRPIEDELLKIWIPAIAFILIHIPLSQILYPLWGQIVTPLAMSMIAYSIFQIVRLKTKNYLTVLFFMLSVLIFAIAEFIWVILESFLLFDPTSNAFLNYLYVIPNLFFLLAIFAFILTNQSHWHQVQFALDTLAVTLLTIGTIYILFFDSQILGQIDISSESLTAFLYLVLDALAISFAITVALSTRSVKFDSGYQVIILGLLIFFSADVMYTRLILSNSFISYEIADWLYMIAYLLISVGIRLAFINYKRSPRQDIVDKYHNEGPIWTSIWLFIYPIVTVLFRKLNRNDILFFSSILIAYYLFSLAIQSNMLKERLLIEKENHNRILESQVNERTIELKKANDDLIYSIRHDNLTGLYSRKYFLDLIDQNISNEDSVETIHLILVDIDRFKSLNDAYGQDIVDAALVEISQRIANEIDNSTDAARVGAGEFAILFKGFRQEQLEYYVQNILSCCQQTIYIAPFGITLNVHIGIATCPDHARTASEAYKCAHIAVEYSRSSRTNQYAIYDKSFDERATRRHQIEQALNVDRFDNEFQLFYQPQFDMDGDNLFGIEALVRWDSPIIGKVNPDEFISVAEDSGKILSLGYWIMRKSMEQITNWNNRYSRNYKIGINISPIQIEDATFIGKVKELINETNVNPSWLVFEITESSALNFQENIVNILSALSDLGIKIAIDDFGTGYSSFIYLKRYSIDYLKIDKILIDNIEKDEEDKQIVKAIISMTKILKIKTIAEGVETKAQLEILKELGCEIIQGYYLGRPVSGEVVEQERISKIHSI